MAGPVQLEPAALAGVLLLCAGLGAVSGHSVSRVFTGERERELQQEMNDNALAMPEHYIESLKELSDAAYTHSEGLESRLAHFAPENEDALKRYKKDFGDLKAKTDEVKSRVGKATMAAVHAMDDFGKEF